jgi:hypothetical protein
VEGVDNCGMRDGEWGIKDSEYGGCTLYTHMKQTMKKGNKKWNI